MRISTIQSRHFLYDIHNPGEYTVDFLFKQRDLVLEEVFALAEEAGRRGTDLIVTPESVNASLFPGDERHAFSETGEPLDGPLMARFGALAKAYNTYIVAGLYTAREGRMYNSAVLFHPGGHIQGLYDKTHPTDGERQGITPGERYPVFDTEFGRIGMLVCFDMQYPEAVRELALAGADLIACPTWGWENLYGLCRAYESSVYIAAANALPPHGVMWEWCDPSCIVDPMGVVLAAGPRDRTGIVTAEADIRCEPARQYSSEPGAMSMRGIRASLRRPETYRLITASRPPLMDRYAEIACSSIERQKEIL